MMDWPSLADFSLDHSVAALHIFLFSCVFAGLLAQNYYNHYWYIIRILDESGKSRDVRWHTAAPLEGLAAGTHLLHDVAQFDLTCVTSSETKTLPLAALAVGGSTLQTLQSSSVLSLFREQAGTTLSDPTQLPFLSWPAPRATLFVHRAGSKPSFAGTASRRWNALAV